MSALKQPYQFKVPCTAPPSAIPQPPEVELPQSEFFEAFATARITKLYLDQHSFAQVDYGLVKQGAAWVAVMPEIPGVEITLTADMMVVIQVDPDKNKAPYQVVGVEFTLAGERHPDVKL